MSATTSLAAELIADERIVSLVERALDAERRILAVQRLDPAPATAEGEHDRRRNAIHAAQTDQRHAYEQIGERVRLLIIQAARSAS